MLSFSKKIKKEIFLLNIPKRYKKYFLNACISNGANINIFNKFQITISNENLDIIRKINQELKSLYTIETEISIIQSLKFNPKKKYSLKILNSSRTILKDLAILDDKLQISSLDLKELSSMEKISYYLCGVFFLSGSINNPETGSYHLELRLDNQNYCENLQQVLEKVNIKAKVFQRKNQFILYIKASELISDFLKLIKCNVMMMEFEDVRIKRDFNNSVYRLENCRIANDVKTINSANAQLDKIELLRSKGILDNLDEKLLKVIKIREKYPESSLRELVDLYVAEFEEEISKSGLNHRLKKIMEMEG